MPPHGAGPPLLERAGVGCWLFQEQKLHLFVQERASRQNAVNDICLQRDVRVELLEVSWDPA